MFVDLSLGRQLWVKDRSRFSCAKLLFLWRLKLHLLLHNIIQWSYDFSLNLAPFGTTSLAADYALVCP